MNGEMNYETILAWLEAKKNAIDQAIAGVRALVGLEQSDGSVNLPPLRVSGSGEVESGTFLGMGIGEATKRYLAMVKKPQTTAAICEALKRGGLHSTAKHYTANVYAILSRQERNVGDIVNVNRQWGLKEWFPNLRRERQKPDAQAPERDSKPNAAARPGSRKAVGASLRDRAKHALSKAGKPLKVDEVAALMATDGGTIHRASLEVALSYLVRHDSSVRRVSPGVYELK
jgi:hypothetical protein